MIQALDGTQACILGCIDRGEHQPTCACHDHCPDHEGHCAGCAPRPAHDDSLLCGRCFYVKLKRPLRRVPAIYDWLTSRKAGVKAAAYDGDRVTLSKDRPLPFNVEIVTHLQDMDRNLDAWVGWVSRMGIPAAGPKTKDAPASAVWLEQRAGWIAEQDWVTTMIEDLKASERTARQLAPWQPTRHALPVPCLRCERQDLVLFGGEDWVTCTNPDCDAIMALSRYRTLSRALGRLYENEGGVAG